MKTDDDIPLAKIRIDGGTQPRVSIDQDSVAEHKAGYELGESRPPLDVFFDGTEYWLADGFHRYLGALQARLDEHPCTVRTGTQRDAILFSVGTNVTHGLRRTSEDKRKAIKTLLDDPEWAKNSQRWIAEKCGVSPQSVSNMIDELSKMDSQYNRQGSTTGKDGVKRRVRKPKAKQETQSDKQVSATEEATVGKPSHGTKFDPSEFDPAMAKDAKPLPSGTPEHIKPVLADLAEFRSLQREVSLLMGKVTTLSKKPIGSYIVVQEIERHINQVKADLKAYSFGDNCPDCQNKPDKKCQRCKGRGWIAYGQMGQLSDLHKAWLKEHSVKP